MFYICTPLLNGNSKIGEKFKMQNAKWTLQDVLGNEILFNNQPSTNNNILYINIQHLQSGVYLVDPQKVICNFWAKNIW
jgi:hypothetical protein